MIERFYPSHTKLLPWLLEFCQANPDHDFYYTRENTRIYVHDLKSLSHFLHEASCIYVSQNSKGDYDGVILVWKSLGGDKERYYVKVNAATNKIARGLITVLNWNFFKELFVKIRTDNKFVDTFKSKGFKFVGGRGIQILLRRRAEIIQNKYYEREED